MKPILIILTVISKVRSTPTAILLKGIAEGCTLAVIVLSTLLTVGILIYQCSTSTGPYRSEYSGKIIDKKVALYESDKGSYFVERLTIREQSGAQFRIGVSKEIYDRARIGMLILKNSRGIELFPDPDPN